MTLLVPIDNLVALEIQMLASIFVNLQMLAFHCTKSAAPGEARTHNPGITFCTVYKYRALTDCATGAHWQKGSLQVVGFEQLG